jgi:hypothetical protein
MKNNKRSQKERGVINFDKDPHTLIRNYFYLFLNFGSEKTVLYLRRKFKESENLPAFDHSDDKKYRYNLKKWLESLSHVYDKELYKVIHITGIKIPNLLQDEFEPRE